MKILAFETSCDDTAVAVVQDGTQVLAAVRDTQTEHDAYGGVVPEIAARLHAEHWRPVLEQCLEEAKLKMDDIDALAVTVGPGLQTSLLTGTTVASMLSLLYDKPLIPVHHIHAHVCSVFLGREKDTIPFPALVLVASGGHTQLMLCQNATEMRIIGKTRDDAVGECFDKVAKALNLGYPGGPEVSRAAEGGSPTIKFPMPMLERDSLDFSFSGLKAAVRREVEQAGENPPTLDICASFENTVMRIICKKIERAFIQYESIKSVCFVGGVSANLFLRRELAQFVEKNGRKFFTTVTPEYSTDNAAMVASSACFLYQKNPRIARVQQVDANPKLPLV